MNLAYKKKTHHVRTSSSLFLPPSSQSLSSTPSISSRSVPALFCSPALVQPEPADGWSVWLYWFLPCALPYAV
jgi:hypothetical protein